MGNIYVIEQGVSLVGSDTEVVLESTDTSVTLVASEGLQVAYTTIQDEGVDLPQRPILDITGTGYLLTDDGAGNRTVLDLTGGGGGVSTVENLGSTTFLQNQFPMWVASSGSFFGRGVPNQVTVGVTGADFTSVKSACDYVATQSPNAGSLWRVVVYPGPYTEVAFTVPDYTAVCGLYAGDATGKAFNDARSPMITNDASVTTGAFVTLGNSSMIYGLNIRFAIVAPATISGACVAVLNPSISGVHQSDIVFCYIEMYGDASTFTTTIVKADSKTLCGRNTFVQTSNPATNAIGCWARLKEIGLFYSVLAYTGGDAAGALVAFKHENSETSGLIFSRLFKETGFTWGTCISATAGSVFVADTPYNTSSGSQFITHFDTLFTSQSGTRESGGDSDVATIFKGHSPTQVGDMWQTQTSSGSVQMRATATGSLITPAFAMQNGAVPNYYLQSKNANGDAQWAAASTSTQYWSETSGSLTPLNNDILWPNKGMKSPWHNVVIVDSSGSADFTSVKAACDYVTTQTPSITNPWNVLIFNGVYTEAPFTVPVYTCIKAFHTMPLSSPFSQSVTIMASAAWTGGAFITLAGVASGLSNLAVSTGVSGFSGATDWMLISCAASPRIDTCYLNAANIGSTHGYVLYGSGIFVNNSVIAGIKTSTGSMICAQSLSASQYRACIFPGSAPTEYIRNTSGTTTVQFCRLGPSAGPNATLDLNAQGGALVINNVNYKTSAGTVTIVDGLPNFAKAVANTNTPAGATAFAMPVYDATGVLKGYLPLYTAQW